MLFKKNILFLTVYITVFSLGILTGYLRASSKKEYIYIEKPLAVLSDVQEDLKKAPQSQETERRTFFVKSINEKIYIYIQDTTNGMQLDSEIDYIDLYSLEPIQQETLLKGIELPDRESVAEYIQDLGS